MQIYCVKHKYIIPLGGLMLCNNFVIKSKLFVVTHYCLPVNDASIYTKLLTVVAPIEYWHFINFRPFRVVLYSNFAHFYPKNMHF